MTDILMPALSPTMEEGTLAKWHVKKGDTVKSGDVIAEIETDKATMEVEAVDEGVVDEILIAEGSEGVKVNTPIARLAGEGEAPAPKAEAPKAEAPKAEAAPAKAPEPAKAEAPKPAPAAAPAPAKAADGGRIFASPLARRLAEQKGLDLSAMTGSGPHGRIVKVDVDKAGPGQAKAPPAAPAGAPAAQAPRQAQTLEQMGIAAGSYELIPLDGMRKTVARRMTDSFRDVPHFPLNMDLEIDELLAARAKINAMLEKQGVKVSVNDMVIKAAAIALMRVPEANASYTPEGIALHKHADIAMAVAVPGGLITPIIRAAETKGLAQIATEAKDLAERARTKKLKPEEFQGGTFSISNLGMFGIKSFASIINEPQGAIISVGAGEKRPVVRGDQLVIATVMSVTLTCDHRVVDGATGAKWLAAFKPLIEDPLNMIV
ncbi:MAG: pyruvate dehydrogenase complex dihydrolipoamide acetyltransferase [Phenylobacterium sp. RIFCSPHIGHO2_01_FULL_69_31]|uniref:pyruvate dehydrogenase complex dihydrolipoamide acetyltransferase n=1 Tax=Phenylobacterium sp. RIFCSPHIGHO2_01_FULL_69_31 TaxID=1801944 RepID=UPI0008D2FFC0|nr:pyruvate dehydrogenase complex dihydrolipoamide acetyltransferase [Phenylobacterium sp. RIFCSPHIGHO2_01_FULL_69_31]OHB28096.1 MAG: pyruvate dehydrogenase complex dihydrolipoamide acetyltransferase [Phenylobacterium sp. RIFCSPHIGHO2_01_FULL_69_31]